MSHPRGAIAGVRMLTYYCEHADEFIERTADMDMVLQARNASRL